MEKWNFDVIFTGTNEEQEAKAARFRTGLFFRIKEACGRYTDAVLAGEDSEQAGRRYARVRELEEAHAALVNDPRGVALREWVEKRDAEKQAEQVKDMIVELIVGGPRGHKQ